MVFKKGSTLIELMVVLVIIGVIVAVAMPSFISSSNQTRIQAVENNLRAIAAAEQKYYEDYNKYYASSNFDALNSHLSLTMSDQSLNYGFIYTCAAAGGCSASSASLGETVSTDVNGNFTCSGPFSPCP